MVGGVLTQTMSWRAIYGINAPIGLLLLAGVVVAVPATRSQTSSNGSMSRGPRCWWQP